MNWRQFLKPTGLKLLLFVVLAVLLFILLTSRSARIDFFPCQTRAVIEEPAEYRNDWCGLWQLAPGYSGTSISFTLSSLVVILLVLFVLPYLLAGVLAHLLSRKAANQSP